MRVLLARSYADACFRNSGTLSSDALQPIDDKGWRKRGKRRSGRGRRVEGGGPVNVRDADLKVYYNRLRLLLLLLLILLCYYQYKKLLPDCNQCCNYCYCYFYYRYYCYLPFTSQKTSVPFLPPFSRLLSPPLPSRLLTWLTLPPASLSNADTTTLTSCDTSTAARSHVNSAALDHRIRRRLTPNLSATKAPRKPP